TAGGAAPDAFETDIGFDKASAQKHLADAGFPNGQGFPLLKMLVRDTPEARAQAEFLKKGFKEILNIDTELDPVDSATRSQRLNDHQYELAPRSGWSQDYPDPENWIISLFDTGGSNNVYTCSDKDIDALIMKASAGRRRRRRNCACPPAYRLRKFAPQRSHRAERAGAIVGERTYEVGKQAGRHSYGAVFFDLRSDPARSSDHQVRSDEFQASLVRLDLDVRRLRQRAACRHCTSHH